MEPVDKVIADGVMVYAPTVAVARFPEGEPLYPNATPLTASEFCNPLTMKLALNVPEVGAVDPNVFD